MRHLTLVLEASTAHPTVALVSDGTVVAHASVTTHDPLTGARVEGLMPAIITCLAEARVTPLDLSAVACSAGPGGFTSLRSAAAVAKGVCSARDIPLYAIPAMDLLVASAQLLTGRYVAALDAGRDEYYASTVEVLEGGAPEIGPVTLLSRLALTEHAHARRATLVGPHMEVNVSPHAGAALLLLPRITAAGPVDLDAWEPWYGRLAEAQVKWESAHGRPLPS